MILTGEIDISVGSLFAVCGVVAGVLAKAGGRLEALAAPDPVEALGINDRKQLAAVAALKPQAQAAIAVQRGERALELQVTVAQRPRVQAKRPER